MNTICLPGRFDGKGVVLDSPCELPANTPVLVTVIHSSHSEGSLDSFRNDWYAMGRQALAAAYSDDEPEYSEADLVP